MPNSRQREAMLSPSLSRITKRIRSSITEHSFHGIPFPAPFRRKSVTHVSGTFCYLCLGTVIRGFNRFSASGTENPVLLGSLVIGADPIRTPPRQPRCLDEALASSKEPDLDQVFIYSCGFRQFGYREPFHLTQ